MEKDYTGVFGERYKILPKENDNETAALLNDKFAEVKDFVQTGIGAEDYYRIKKKKKI